MIWIWPILMIIVGVTCFMFFHLSNTQYSSQRNEHLRLRSQRMLINKSPYVNPFDFENKPSIREDFVDEDERLKNLHNENAIGFLPSILLGMAIIFFFTGIIWVFFLL